MSYTQDHHGGAPVGMLAELDSTRFASVVYLRLWCDGPESRSEVLNDFASVLGDKRGAQAVQSLSDLCSVCAKHGRRPLMRHAVRCKCLGSDESCFANFVATAAEGEREDALMIATLLVRPDMAPLLTAMAADLGLALKRMRLSIPNEMTQIKSGQKTLH